MEKTALPPTLFIFSGLPGSGKTTLAQLLARQLQLAYLRIDTIEQGLRDLCSLDVQGEGYRLAYRLAADNLQCGTGVVADSCNPIALTRHEWEQVARENGASHLNIEVICSDSHLHRQRVENRNSTVPGLTLPTWQDVVQREYHPWTQEHIVIDTAHKSVEVCLKELLAHCR